MQGQQILKFLYVVTHWRTSQLDDKFLGFFLFRCIRFYTQLFSSHTRFVNFANFLNQFLVITS